jgi:DNA-binding MarR family transcriptional regulator
LQSSFGRTILHLVKDFNGAIPVRAAAVQPELARRLNAAAMHMARALRERSPGALAAEHQSVLMTVVFGGPIAIGALARREGVGAPAMTKAVDVLERYGYVQRERDRHDGRMVRVVATLAGKRAVLRGRDGRIARIRSALASLDGTDRERLQAAVEAFDRLAAELVRAQETPSARSRLPRA